jgi:hypothetical protein
MEPEGLLQVAAREIFFNANERSVLNEKPNDMGLFSFP